MGIIRAIKGSVGSVMKEQWKEAFFCDSLPAGILMVRGRKHVSERSANDRTDDEIVTNGSLLSVADGQCVLVVSQGKIVDMCDASGEHTFVDPNHPGGVRGLFHDVISRVGFGGDVQPIRHRVYYINTKECHGNRFETPAPIAIRVRDRNTDADFDLSVSAAGVYAYRVADPKALYRAIGNIETVYERRLLNAQLCAEILSALQTAVSAAVQNGVRPYELPKQTHALGDAVVAAVGNSFMQRFGVALLSISFESLKVEDVHMLSTAQHAAMLKDPEMAAAVLIDATAAALNAAAQNRSTQR